MSNMFGGKTRAQVIEEKKLQDRERYEELKELERQKQDQDVAMQKATEKSPFEELLGKHEQARQIVEGIQIGHPYALQQTIQAVKLLCEVTGELLAAIKPEDGEEAGQ